MSKVNNILAAILCSSLLWGCTPLLKAQQSAPPEPAQPAPTPEENEAVVRLVPSSIKCMSDMQVNFDSAGKPQFIEPHPIKLVKGVVRVDDNTTADIYIPARGPYSTTTKENHSLSNTSTLIYSDSNGDGQMDRTERWWSSLPIRLGDKMFEVKKFDPGSTWLLLAQSSKPLSGLVMNKPCIPFNFTMSDGKPITLNDYKGKTLLLDVWSMT